MYGFVLFLMKSSKTKRKTAFYSMWQVVRYETSHAKNTNKWWRNTTVRHGHQTDNTFALIASYCTSRWNSSQWSFSKMSQCAFIYITQLSAPVKPITLGNQVKKKKKESLFDSSIQSVLYAYSWYIHISHTSVRTLRPKPSCWKD